MSLQMLGFMVSVFLCLVISLVIIIRTSTDVIANARISCLWWLNNIPLYIWTITFIQSSLDGHIGCFYPLAIVNCAVMNIGVHTLLFCFSLHKSPEVQMQRQMVYPFGRFWETSRLFSIAAAPICNPTNGVWGLPFLHSLGSTCSLSSCWQSFWWMSGDISLCFQFAFLWWLVILSIFSCVY